MMDTEEEEGKGEDQIEFFASPSEPEQLFVEAVRKLSSYEHSLETLVKRFEGEDGTLLSGELHSSNASVVPGMSGGGDNSIRRRKHGTQDDRQKKVKIQIPFRTAEIILRILDEDLEKTQRSALKQAELCLDSAKRNLVNVKEMLQIQLANSDSSHRTTLMKTNEIANDVSTSIDNLGETLIECQVENLSELLVTAMKDEARLSMLAKRPAPRNEEEMRNIEEVVVREKPSNSTGFYALIFFFVASYFLMRLLMLYLEREGQVIEKIHQFVWHPFQEEMKQLVAHLESTFR